MTNLTTARALGWVSVGIGLSELVAPGWIQRNLLGTGGHTSLVRSMGLRELLSGMSILTERRPTPQLKAGLWSRVAGDVVDLTILGLAARMTRRPSALVFSAAVVVGVMAVDLLCANSVQKEPTSNGRHA
jgi:hypothetical protein